MKQTNIHNHSLLPAFKCYFSPIPQPLIVRTPAAMILTSSTTSDSTPAARSSTMDGEGGGGGTELEPNEEEIEVEPDEAAPQVMVGSSGRLRSGTTLGEEIL